MTDAANRTTGGTSVPPNFKRKNNGKEEARILAMSQMQKRRQAFRRKIIYLLSYM